MSVKSNCDFENISHMTFLADEGLLGGKWAFLGGKMLFFKL
jgi:hypothetical protein